jgi:hypothetical protein
MKGVLYLYVCNETETGGYSTPKTAKMSARVHNSKTTPKHNEVEFKLSLDIPDEFFEKPTYEAQISLTKSVKSSTPSLTLSPDAVETWLEHKAEPEEKEVL